MRLCNVQHTHQTTPAAVAAYVRLHSAYYSKCRSGGTTCEYSPYNPTASATASTDTGDHVSEHVRTQALVMGVPVVVTFGDQMSQRVAAPVAAAAGTTAAAAVTEDGELQPGLVLTAGIFDRCSMCTLMQITVLHIGTATIVYDYSAVAVYNYYAVVHARTHLLRPSACHKVHYVCNGF
jgi:hypothetical protein